MKRPWIKQRLRELGKKPAELARAMGVDNARVHELASGARKHIKVDEMAPFCRFLNMSEEEVAALEAGAIPSPSNLDGSTHEFLSLLGKASENTKERALQFLVNLIETQQ